MQSVPITTKIVNLMSICLDILAFPICFLFNNVISLLANQAAYLQNSKKRC